MNTSKFSYSDKSAQNLWFSAQVSITYHEQLHEVTEVSKLKIHATQVEELVEEISYTLRKFPKWKSGQDNLDDLLRIRDSLGEYGIQVLREIKKNPAETLLKFNENSQRFYVIASEILDLYSV